VSTENAKNVEDGFSLRSTTSLAHSIQVLQFDKLTKNMTNR